MLDFTVSSEETNNYILLVTFQKSSFFSWSSPCFKFTPIFKLLLHSAAWAILWPIGGLKIDICHYILTEIGSWVDPSHLQKTFKFSGQDLPYLDLPYVAPKNIFMRNITILNSPNPLYFLIPTSFVHTLLFCPEFLVPFLSLGPSPYLHIQSTFQSSNLSWQTEGIEPLPLIWAFRPYLAISQCELLYTENWQCQLFK